MERYRKILVVIAEDSDPGPALRRALRLARSTGAELTLLDIAEPAPEETRGLIGAATLEALESAAVERRTAALLGLAAEAESAGVPVLKRMVSGSPFRVAIRTVLREGHDLLLKTMDTGDGHARSPQGSTDKHLLRKCPCPVWLIAPGEDGGRVLAAVNPDPDAPEDRALSAEILELAGIVARLDGVGLDVLHAWRVFGELLLGGPRHLVPDQEVDHIMGKALNRHAGFLQQLIDGTPLPGITPARHLAHARPADAIISFVASNPVGLLVMGTVGRTGVPGLLIGNTAERVLGEVACSVLALKPRGFVSPVTGD